MIGGGRKGQNVAVNPCPPTGDDPAFRVRGRPLQPNDTSQADDRAVQNCTPFKAGRHKTKRPGLIRVRSVCRSALPQVLLTHRIEQSLLGVNGTGVPDHVTLRPYHGSALRVFFLTSHVPASLLWTYHR